MKQSAADRKIIGGYYPPKITPSRSTRIRFRLITMTVDQDVTPNVININYANENLKAFDHTAGIDDFIDKLVDSPPTERAGLFPTQSPLDINCVDDGFIVFALSSKWNWQFISDGNCFTTKVDQGERYSNLHHIQPSTGNRVGTNSKIGEGCRLLYIRAQGDNSQYRHGFNLGVELILPPAQNSTDPRKTKLIIDPDVRNPGGSGP